MAREKNKVDVDLFKDNTPPVVEEQTPIVEDVIEDQNKQWTAKERFMDIEDNTVIYEVGDVVPFTQNRLDKGLIE